jgi:Flp pilus assembly protein TadD
MQIDPRQDHSIRIPRPDLTTTLGTPNACASCHATQGARWADSAVRAWYGPERKGFQRFAREFAADDSDAADAAPGLRRIAADTSQSAIARASALARLGARAEGTDAELATSAMRDRDPLLRLGALQLLEGLPPAARLGATALLADSLRAVRLQAAWVLAPAADQFTNDNDRAAFARARDEFIASQRFNADRAEHRTTLGTFFLTLGRADDAATEYRAAIALAPQFAPAYVNLADLERSRGHEPEAERVLRDGLAHAPDDARLHHALALSLARGGRAADAVSELAKATSLAPDDATYAYAYAVALNSTGNRATAIRTLETARRKHPADPQLLYGLALFQRDAGNLVAARALARDLLRIRPSDAAARALAASLDATRP